MDSSLVEIKNIETWAEHIKSASLVPEENDGSEMLYSFDEETNNKFSLWKGDIQRLAVDGIMIIEQQPEGTKKEGEDAVKSKTEVLDSTGQLVYTGFLCGTKGMPKDHTEVSNCYENCLELMLENSIKTIAIPCVNPEKYGLALNTKLAAYVILHIAKTFIYENKEKVERIVLCFTHNDDFMIYEDLMQRYFPIAPFKFAEISENMFLNLSSEDEVNDELWTPPQTASRQDESSESRSKMPEKVAKVNFVSLVRKKQYQSKYEKHGDIFLELLQQAKDVGDTRIHPHQLEALLKTYGMFIKNRGMNILGGKDKQIKPVVIVSPTGSEKSGIIVLLPYILKAKKCLILTPSKEISDQLGRAFGKEQEDPNFFQVSGILEKKYIKKMLEPVRMIKKSSDINKNLTNLVIMNAQKFEKESQSCLSLVYNKDTLVDDVKRFFSEFDLLIVVEAHHYPVITWRRIVNTFSIPAQGLVKKIVFMTATPYRENKQGKVVPILANLDQRIAFTIKMEDLEREFIRAAEFHEKDEVEEVTEDIERILTAQVEKEPRFQPQGLIMVATKTDAIKYEGMINDRLGPNYAVALYGGLKNLEQLKTDFDAGQYRVAIVCGLQNVGYDNPKVSLCVILRNLRSQTLFTQFVGRCLRINTSIDGEENDKTTAIVLSYKKFKQRKMWEEMDELAVSDPIDEIEVDDPEEELGVD